MEANKYRYLVERLIGYLADGTELYYVELSGDSGVAIPTTSSNGQGAICDGSICLQSDNGKMFFYNEADGWVEQFSFIQS